MTRASSRIEIAIDANTWQNSSQEASKEEYKSKQKFLEAVAKYAYLPSFHFSGMLITPTLVQLCRGCMALQVVLLVASLVQAVLWLRVASFES
jgi:hypothetical protein